MTTLILKGIVAPGKGGGKNYLDDESIKQQVEQSLGFKPYPGTMNVKLSEESVHKRQQAFLDEGRDRPKVSSYPGKLIEASIESIKCAILKPDDPNYPNDTVEVIAPVNLREKLNIIDGSEVTIKVNTGISNT